MTSPNEPGYPRAADGPGNANGALPDESETGSIGNAMGRGHVTDPGDTPPWQRGPAARGAAGAAPPGAGGLRPEPHRGGGPSGHPPGVDARLNRFISGGSAASAPAPETADQPPRSEPTRNDPPPRSEPPRNDPPPRSEPPRNDPPPRSEPPRNEAPVSEAYASELPGPVRGDAARTPPRKAAPERSEPPARAAVPRPCAGCQPSAGGAGPGQPCRSAGSIRGARSRFRWCCRWRCSSCG